MQSLRPQNSPNVIFNVFFLFTIQADNSQKKKGDKIYIIALTKAQYVQRSCSHRLHKHYRKNLRKKEEAENS